MHEKPIRTVSFLAENLTLDLLDTMQEC